MCEVTCSSAAQPRAFIRAANSPRPQASTLPLPSTQSWPSSATAEECCEVHFHKVCSDFGAGTQSTSMGLIRPSITLQGLWRREVEKCRYSLSLQRSRFAEKSSGPAFRACLQRQTSMAPGARASANIPWVLRFGFGCLSGGFSEL